VKEWNSRKEDEGGKSSVAQQTLTPFGDSRSLREIPVRMNGGGGEPTPPKNRVGPKGGAGFRGFRSTTPPPPPPNTNPPKKKGPPPHQNPKNPPLPPPQNSQKHPPQPHTPHHNRRNERELKCYVNYCLHSILKGKGRRS